MKNQSLKFSLLFLISILAIAGCKKGSDDPFFSFISRNKRIQGNWELIKEDYKMLFTYYENGTAVKDSTLKIFDGNMMTETNSGIKKMYSYSWEIKINKDGTYNEKRVVDGLEARDTGNWRWLSDKKSKTRIVFSHIDIIYVVEGLRNDELILKKELSELHGDNESLGESTFTESRILTFIKK